MLVINGISRHCDCELAFITTTRILYFKSATFLIVYVIVGKLLILKSEQILNIKSKMYSYHNFVIVIRRDFFLIVFNATQLTDILKPWPQLETSKYCEVHTQFLGLLGWSRTWGSSRKIEWVIFRSGDVQKWCHQYFIFYLVCPLWHSSTGVTGLDPALFAYTAKAA